MWGIVFSFDSVNAVMRSIFRIVRFQRPIAGAIRRLRRSSQRTGSPASTTQAPSSEGQGLCISSMTASTAAAGKKDDRRQRKPPAVDRIGRTKERGDRKSQKDDSGKNDKGEDAVEGAQSQHRKSHTCLKQHGIGRRTEA